MLSNLPTDTLNSKTVGFETSEDCAIFPLDNGQLLIQSVDFFTPIVDDAKTFGKIAAVNSLSDIYAMGGTPLFALNVAGFPSDELPLSVLTNILQGGIHIAQDAGISILGGHTIKDDVPKYGLVVTGMVDSDKIVRNNSAKPGDILVLTKPLGLGIISTAIKNNNADKDLENTAIETMLELNKSASEIMVQFDAHACTDITGYGLLGHLMEMCEGSHVSAQLKFSSIPFIDGVENLAEEGVIPGGTKKNLAFVKDRIDFASHIQPHQQLMLADAQTSGGLLISIDPSKVNDLVSKLNEKNVMCAEIIGNVQEYNSKSIKVD